MRYIGKFKDINNKSFRVEIITNNDYSQSTEITLADEPFTTTYKGDDDNIYQPYIASESTVRIITDNPMLDIYSATATGTSVALFDDVTNSIEWCGYVEPQLYNSDWESDKDIIELNCLDSIAILQYLDFTEFHNYESFHTRTFYNILLNFFSLQSQSFPIHIHEIYFPNTLQETYDINNDTNREMLQFALSEQNFFDEDDKSMKCDEILTHMCQFLNYTAIQYKNDIYLLDWDAMVRDKYACNEISLLNWGYWERPTLLQDRKIIDANSYSENGATISLAPVYNKITIKDDLYPIENIFPSLDDGITNYGGKGHVEVVRTPYQPYAVTGKFAHKSYFQFFKSPYCKFYHYFMDGDLDNQGSLTPRWTSPSEPYSINYGTLRRYVGATLLAHKCEDYNDKKDEPAKLTLENMLLIHCHDKFPTSNIPLLTVGYENKEFQIGNNTYLIIGGDAIFMDDVDDKNDKGVSEMILATHERKHDDFHLDRLYLEIILNSDAGYWNGTDWQDTECTFKMPFEFEDKADNHFIGKTIPIKNTVSWRDNLDAKGYKILMPKGCKGTSVSVTFLAPKQRIDNSYRLEAIWIKNFKIDFKVSNIQNSSLLTEEEEDTDTEYTNVINEKNVKEMDDITFKICTYDGKTTNYSSVYYNNEFIDTLVYTPTGERQRMEEHLITKLVNQYSTPSVILDVNFYNDFTPWTLYSTHFFPNKLFIVNAAEINWEMNKAALHLIEKK